MRISAVDLFYLGELTEPGNINRVRRRRGHTHDRLRHRNRLRTFWHRNSITTHHRVTRTVITGRADLFRAPIGRTAAPHASTEKSTLQEPRVLRHPMTRLNMNISRVIRHTTFGFDRHSLFRAMSDSRPIPRMMPPTNESEEIPQLARKINDHGNIKRHTLMRRRTSR